MQFTPQQMSGGPKYNSKAKIGNYFEDLALDRAKIDEFQERATQGTQLQKLRMKQSQCNQTAPHTFSEDGIIRFGDIVVLQHDLTSSTLACDPFDEIFPAAQKYRVTGSTETIAVARNTFRILRPTTRHMDIADDPDDPILKIGQAFCLGCNESLLVTQSPSLLSPQLYLCSTLKNDRATTKVSNKQLVYLSESNNADSIWIVQVPSLGLNAASDRVLAVGSPVYSEDSYVFTHKQTNTNLTVDPALKDITDFGSELECFTSHVQSNGILSLIHYEFTGKSTATSLAKPDVPNNLWHFETSRNPDSSYDHRVLPPAASYETVLEDILNHARSSGPDGIISLRLRLIELDNKCGNDGMLDKEDVKTVITRWGCKVRPSYLDIICDKITNKGFLVQYKKLLSVVRGPLAASRREAIQELFAQLDTSGQGLISSEDLLTHFQVSEHPSAMKLNSQDIMKGFKAYFSIRGKIGPFVRYPEFEEYFADMSACIEDDFYFREILRSLFA